MSKRLHWLLVLLLLASVVLGACTPATPVPPTAAPTAVPATPQPPQPTEAPTAVPTPVPTPAPDLVGAFTQLLGVLTPDKAYGAITAAQLNEALATEPPFLLDVREPAEVEKDGYIEGAVHIAVRDLLKNLDKLPAQDQPIVVYCASGHRGALAMASLRLLGYTDVTNLAGGLGAWTKAALPVATGKPAEAASLNQSQIADQAMLSALDSYLASLPEGFYTIKAAGLNEALAGDPPFILDVRTPAEWDSEGYIEGAVQVPLNDLMANLDKLPAQGEPIVVYCRTGHRAAVAMQALQLAGYSKVINLAGGLNAWKGATLPVAGWVDWPSTWAAFLASTPANEYFTVKAEGLNEALATEPPFLLDVREPAEVEKDGFIDGAINIPVREVLQNLDKLPAPDQPIVIYCASGHRGAIALGALRLLGYENVRNLAGGLNAWAKAALPVATGAPAVPVSGEAPQLDAARLKGLAAFVESLADGFYAMKAADLNTAMAEANAPLVLDVRTPDEFQAGHIEGAVNIPVDVLVSELGQLPDKKAAIVTMCKTGHRAALAMMALRMLGYENVSNLGGGMGAWAAAELPVTAP